MCERFSLDFPEAILKNWYTVNSFPDLIPRHNIAPMSRYSGDPGNRN